MEKNTKKFTYNLSRDNLYNHSYHEAMDRPLSLISYESQMVSLLPKYEELYRNSNLLVQESEMKLIEGRPLSQKRLAFRKMSSGFETQQTTLSKCFFWNLIYRREMKEKMLKWIKVKTLI